VRHGLVWRRIVYWITSRLRAVGGVVSRLNPTRVWLPRRVSDSPSAGHLRAARTRFCTYRLEYHARAGMWPRSHPWAGLCGSVSRWDSASVWLPMLVADRPLERHTTPRREGIPTNPSGSLPSVGVWCRSRRSGGGHSRSKGLYAALTSWDPTHVWVVMVGTGNALEQHLAASGRVFPSNGQQELAEPEGRSTAGMCAGSLAGVAAVM
jgi:hypothetical protein